MRFIFLYGYIMLRKINSFGDSKTQLFFFLAQFSSQQG